MNRIKRNILNLLSLSSMVLIGLYLYGCTASSTAITATWTNEEIQPETYDHIMVAPFIADRGLKAVMENELAQSLSDKNVKVNMGSNFLPNEYASATADKEDILESVKTRGAKAILTVSIIDKESETRYVPGTYTYSPYATYTYYGSFWGYYDYWYPRVYEPGYYVTDRYYFLETNLFDAETEKLIWSAQTKTYDPATLESFTDDFSRKIALQLKEDGII